MAEIMDKRTLDRELERRGIDRATYEKAVREKRERERAMGLHDGWALALCPRILPANWRLVREAADGCAYISATGLQVIVSASVEDDGKRWLHVSCSRDQARTLPSWADLVEMKTVFIGADKYAYQVLAPRRRHVNLGEVLHLWHCLDGNPIPEFAKAGTV